PLFETFLGQRNLTDNTYCLLPLALARDVAIVAATECKHRKPMRLVIVIVTQPTPRLIISARQLIQRCGTKFRMHCQKPHDFQSTCIADKTDAASPGITVTIRLDQVPPQ